MKKHQLTALALALGELPGKGDVNVPQSDVPALLREQQQHERADERQNAAMQQRRQLLQLKLNHDQAMQQQRQVADLQRLQSKLDADAQLKKELQTDKLQHQLKLATVNAAAKSASKNGPNTPNRNTIRTPLAMIPFRISDTDGKMEHGYWSLSPDTAAQLIQTAIDLGDNAQIDYIRRVTGASPDSDRRTISAKALALQNRVVAGQFGARNRMMALLSAIIPSLRGKGLIDGLLNNNYVKTQLKSKSNETRKQP